MSEKTETQEMPVKAEKPVETAVTTVEKPVVPAKTDVPVKTEKKPEAPVKAEKPAEQAKEPAKQEKKPEAQEKTEKTPELPAKTELQEKQEKKTDASSGSLVFGKWSTDEVKISDLGLVNYITFDRKRIPHSFGKMTRERFQKGELGIIERLVNKLMRSGQGKRKLSGKYIRGRKSCGKKLQALKIVEAAFELVEKQTNQNPVQALVSAIEHAAPREDTTRIKRGGIAYSVSVDVAPLRRVDEALKNIAIAAFASSFNNKTTAAQALAKELILASKEDNASFSVKRRDEVERIAKSSR